MNAQLNPVPVDNVAAVPRLGFLGVGWIGLQRMQALADSGVASVAAVCDTHAGAARAALESAPDALVATDLGELLDAGLDGVVIATPSGAHAEQAIAALEHGLAVFCQKPLTRTEAEAERVVAAARLADRLVGVDFSYRHVNGVDQLRNLVRGGALGELHAIDLTFHNAYGPDKDWFYDMAQSGGGCVMDLGIHLLDLAHWITGDGAMDTLDALLSAQGRALPVPVREVEDYASVQWRLRSGAIVRMTCSWRLPAGCEAVIEASFYGSHGGASLRNVDGSFYDFTVDRFDGTGRERLASPPDAWGGRALVHWAQQLADGGRFNPEAEQLIQLARVVDGIYGR